MRSSIAKNSVHPTLESVGFLEPNSVIAEPHDSVVARIIKIENELLQPKRVIPEFARSVYQSFQSIMELNSRV
ncbi:hypothetical protein CIL03_13850 [Virgibacillus indicus]|uniref:Uncharacterized protein n=1 Tax=Virgibacillus indicus TaxID=2024554 RepID=A0A265N8K8_9BACI|nr:hypothetical protein CIL03_13850 [Virgibacillus indicus]